MLDVVARAPYVAAPDIVLYRDEAELDLWLRAPYAGSPDLVAYGRGPVSDAVAEAPSGDATGTLNVTLGELTLAATASTTAHGALAVTLGALTVAGTASTVAHGALAVTLGALTVAGTASTTAHGTLAVTLGALTLAGAASTTAHGTLAVTLGAVTLAGAASTVAHGALAVTLGAVTLSATGTVEAVESVTSTGTLAVTLGELALTARAYVRNQWKPTMNYSIAFSSHFAGVQGVIAAGDVICRSTSNTYAIASAANLAAGGVPTAIAITAGSSGIPVMLQYTGEVDASIVDLDPGVEALAIVTSAGRVARLVTPTPTDVVIGRVDTAGNVALAFAVPRVPRYGSEAPTTGTWAVSDIVYNSAPAAAGFLGWVCTVAGTPGTWKGFGLIDA